MCHKTCLHHKHSGSQGIGKKRWRCQDKRGKKRAPEKEASGFRLGYGNENIHTVHTVYTENTNINIFYSTQNHKAGYQNTNCIDGCINHN